MILANSDNLQGNFHVVKRYADDTSTGNILKEDLKDDLNVYRYTSGENFLPSFIHVDLERTLLVRTNWFGCSF